MNRAYFEDAYQERYTAATILSALGGGVNGSLYDGEYEASDHDGFDERRDSGPRPETSRLWSM